MLKIQYASNFFLHKYQTWQQAKHLLTVGAANNLALLGNIGIPQHPNTKNFLLWCADNWESVYYVPGMIELQNKPRFNDNINYILPRNIFLADQMEIALPHHIYLICTPLFSNYGKYIHQIPQWNELEQELMAKRTPKQIQSWHEEDIEFLIERLRTHHTSFGKFRKIILLTHQVPDKQLISNLNCARDLFLYDGSISHLFTENVICSLSGAGGKTTNGLIGRHRTFCAVNAAFQNSLMVPNAAYRSDMVVKFILNDPPTPEWRPSFVKWSKFLSKPELGIATANANPILL